MENVFDGLITKHNQAKNNKLEDILIETSIIEMQREENNEKYEMGYSRTVGQLQEKSNINVMGIPEEKEREKKIFELIMAEDFPKLMTDTKLQIQGAQITPRKINTKTTPRNNIFKLQKNQ